MIFMNDLKIYWNFYSAIWTTQDKNRIMIPPKFTIKKKQFWKENTFWIYIYDLDGSKNPSNILQFGIHIFPEVLYCIYL